MPVAAGKKKKISEMSEQEVAEHLNDALQANADSLKGLDTTVKKLVDDVAKCEGLDAKAINDELEKIRATQKKIKAAIRKRGGVAGLEDEKEAKKFSLVKAIWGRKIGFEEAKAGYELEVMKACHERIKHSIGIESSAGNFVPDQVIADVIEPIYRRSTFINLAGDGQTRVSVMDGLFGATVKIPRFQGGLLAFWLGENDEYVESMARTSDMSLRPKKLTALIRMSEESRRFTAYGYEALLRRDLAMAMAYEIDRAVLYGAGNDNEPRGLIRYTDVPIYSTEAGDVVEAAPVASAGDELDFDGLDNMMGVAEDNNVVAGPSAAVVANPRYFRRLKRIRVPQFPADAAGAYLLGSPMLTDSKLGDIIGAFAKTTMISTNRTSGQSAGWTPADADDTNFTDVFYGAWNEIIFGRWSGLELVDDMGKSVGFTRDQYYTKIRMYGDLGIRHSESFVWSPDVRVRDDA